MAETGEPGSSTSMPEPAPKATVWIRSVTGYRIGVIPEQQALVIEPTDYHCGYLAITRVDFEKLLAEAMRQTAREGPTPVP